MNVNCILGWRTALAKQRGCGTYSENGPKCRQGLELRSGGRDGCEGATEQRLGWNPVNTKLRSLVSHQSSVKNNWWGVTSFIQSPTPYLLLPSRTGDWGYTGGEDTALPSRRLLWIGEEAQVCLLLVLTLRWGWAPSGEAADLGQGCQGGNSDSSRNNLPTSLQSSDWRERV